MEKKIPKNMQSSCGKLYVGRTQQNLENRLNQHKNAIDGSLKHNQKPEIFESAVAEHIFDFPQDNILFDQKNIVDMSIGLLQSFRKIIEIK
jgi:translation elongation factor EF-Ts